MSQWVSQRVSQSTFLVNALQSTFFSFRSLIFSYVSWVGVSQEELICIFKMATKMVELSSGLHIFLSTVHSFHCMGLKFLYVSLLEVSHIICKFGTFAYSIWPLKWLKYAYFPVWSPQFLLYRNLILDLILLNVSQLICEWARCLPKWPNYIPKCILCCL